jgi:hypothetical protein
MRCMWPTEHRGCAEDGAIKLCKQDADFLVGGYSYCEAHTLEYISITNAASATQEVYEEEQWGSPEQLQDRMDNEATGYWTDEISYNGGGDE